MSDTQLHDRYMALLDTFGRQIEHYCILHSNNRADADDLMQEVFVAVWQNLAAVRPEASPRQLNRWLQKVMRTTFIRHLRHAWRHTSDDALCDVAEEPDQDAELLRELAAYLPPDGRRLIELRLQGYSNREIAASLDLAENTLNKRMSRLVAQMKDIYTRLYET